MKQLAILALAMAVTGVPVHPVSAQAFPSKPVRIVVPYAPGGATDVLARAFAAKMAEAWGQPVFVENKPGAGGAIGTEIVARSPADGLTMLMAVPGTLFAKFAANAIDELQPVSLVAIAPNVIAAHPSLQAKTVPELIALAKAKPGQLTYGSAGNGTASHLAGALFANVAGVEMTHVPYKGISLAVNDLLGGQIALSFAVYSIADPHVKAGRLNAIAVTTAKRWPQAPDLPTVAEGGVPGYDVLSWFGLLVPANTPSNIVEKIREEVARIAGLKDLQATFAAQGIQLTSNTPRQFSTFLRDDWTVWDRLMKTTGIKVE